MENSEFDLIVIGAGSTGENVADRAAQGGLSVVIVESDLVGGDCSYWACMPSKALLRPGQALRAARSVAGASAAVGADLDVPAVLQRRDSFTSGWDDASQVEWLDGAGIALVRGRARLTGEREVTVTSGGGERVLRARVAVAVATGSEAVVPDIPGLREAEPWTSKDATSVTDVPESLVVLGGGVVACELATAFTDLGSRVTVVARSGLLGGMEPFAGEAVAAALRDRGATVLLGTAIAHVSRGADGVVVETGDGTRVQASEVLAAMGRAPRTRGLGLAVVGAVDGDWLDVDDTLCVLGSDWLYAVGDVNHRALLTHQGKYQARAAGDAIVAKARDVEPDTGAWGAHVAAADHRSVPQVVFGDPEVASVGLTAQAARDHGLDVSVHDVDLGTVAGASLRRDGYEGRARMVVDARGVVVGMTFVGPDVAEMLHAATIAVVGEVPVSRLWHAVPAYPTMSEVWLRLLEAYGRPAVG